MRAYRGRRPVRDDRQAGYSPVLVCGAGGGITRRSGGAIWNAVEACAVEADPAKHRTLVGTIAAQFGFAVEDPSKLVYVPVLFDMLGARDEKLIPALARANATVQTRLLAA